MVLALTVNETELIQVARDLIKSRFVEGRHHIASALRTRSGAVFTGVHVEAYVGRIAVCAEAIAIGAAATAGDSDIETTRPSTNSARSFLPAACAASSSAITHPQLPSSFHGTVSPSLFLSRSYSRTGTGDERTNSKTRNA